MTSFDEKHRTMLEGLLEPGETPLDRRGDAAGEAESIRPEDVAKASADGVSGGWPNLAAALSDTVALKLDIHTSGGDKVKLMLMRGGGSGVMGSLAGGEGQRDGVAALANWFERAGA